MKVLFYNSDNLLIEHIFQGDTGIRLQILDDNLADCNLIYFGTRNTFSSPAAISPQGGIIDIYIPDNLFKRPTVVVANICVKSDENSIRTKESVYIPVFVKTND